MQLTRPLLPVVPQRFLSQSQDQQMQIEMTCGCSSGKVPTSFDQLAPKSRGRCVSSEKFSVAAVGTSVQKTQDLEATAGRLPCMQDIGRTMKPFLNETKSSSENAWVGDDAGEKLHMFICLLRDL